MPESGQFVAMWTHNNQVWSYTLRIRDGVLYRVTKQGCSEKKLDFDAMDDLDVTFYQ
jgi:hypothetical protein